MTAEQDLGPKAMALKIDILRNERRALADKIKRIDARIARMKSAKQRTKR